MSDSPPPMLRCGCVGVAQTPDGRWACPIHDCTEIDDHALPLAERRARCNYYGQPKAGPFRGSCDYGERGTDKLRCECSAPSSPELPFFEYRGPGSRSAGEICVCGYHQVAHDKKARGEKVTPYVCADFRPRGPAEFDAFYCGCHGWD